MVTKEVSNRIDEIRKEKPNWHEKQVVLQAIGEIIVEKDGLVGSFLLTSGIHEKHIGVLFLDGNMDKIPPKTLQILGENGMSLKKQNLKHTNQIEFC